MSRSILRSLQSMADADEVLEQVDAHPLLGNVLQVDSLRDAMASLDDDGIAFWASVLMDVISAIDSVLDDSVERVEGDEAKAGEEVPRALSDAIDRWIQSGNSISEWRNLNPEVSYNLSRWK
ncbi:MAG: hypothetical protein QGF59_02700 [Pirellulaceae bacterium]|nr:hypothetical protein [Pirellulaceae bacterium]